LAVDGEVHEVVELDLREAAVDEAELQRRLLATLAEIALVERESQLPVLEDEVLPRVVVAASLSLVHGAVGILGASPSRGLGCTGTFTPERPGGEFCSLAPYRGHDNRRRRHDPAGR